MDVSKICIQELKNNPEWYASQCTIDDLLDALNSSKGDEERKSIIIEILKLQNSGKILGKFSNGGFIFNKGVEKYDGNGKYIEIDGKKYYELSEGMNGFGYCCSPYGSGHHYLLYGEFNGGLILQGILIFDNGEKYEGEFKNDVREGQGTFTWANGNKYIGQWENDVREGQGTSLIDGNKYIGQWKRGVLLQLT